MQTSELVSTTDQSLTLYSDPLRPPAEKEVVIRLPTNQMLGRLFGLAAILVFMFGGLGFRWQPGQAYVPPDNGIIATLIGVGLLAVAVRLLRPQHEIFTTTRDAAHTATLRPIPVVIGVVALLIMAEGNARIILRDFQLSQHLQMLFLFGGGLLIAYGFGGFSGIQWKNFTQRLYTPLWIIIAIAAFLRVYNLAESVHIMVDELHFYDGVIRLWQQPNLPMLQYLDGIAQFPHVFSYFEQITVALFGADFFGIRLTSAIFGILTVPAVYLFGRAIGDHKTGLIAAALLAVFPPHIHFSKLALNNIADPLFGALAFGFLVSALRYNRQRDYVLAGLSLGFTAYFYEGGRLVFAGVFFMWLAYMLVAARPFKHIRSMVLMTVLALAILFPYYAYTFSQSGSLAPRVANQGALGYLTRDLETMSIFQVAINHWNVAMFPTISHLLYSPDDSFFYYGGAIGIIHWFLVPFYLLGLAYSLFRMGTSGVLLLLLNVFAIFGLSLAIPSDWTVRYVVIFPILVVTMAVGLRYPLEAVFGDLFKRRWGQIAFALLIGVFAYAQLRQYFVEHLPLYNQQVRLDRYDFYDAWDRVVTSVPEAAWYIHASDTGIFQPVIDSSRVFRNVAMDYQIWRPSEGFAAQLEALPRDQVIAFAIAPDDRATYDAIHAVLPLSPPLPYSSYASVPRDRQFFVFIYYPPGT